MAGIIPGILEAVFYIITIAILCRFKPNLGPPGPKTRFVDKVGAIKSTWGVLILFPLVIGGIYLGVFSRRKRPASGPAGRLLLPWSGDGFPGPA